MTFNEVFDFQRDNETELIKETETEFSAKGLDSCTILTIFTRILMH